MLRATRALSGTQLPARLRARARAGAPGWQAFCAPRRGLSADPSSTDESSLPAPADAMLRGVGQVLFCNSAATGAGLLAALAVADPLLALHAGLGTAAAHTAHANARLDASARADGLASYNGCLVGCAFWVFLPMAGVSAAAVPLATCVGAAASPFVGAAIGEAMGRVPQWTLAFNAVAFTSLLHAKPLAALAPGGSAVASASAAELVLAPLHGISQIFVADSAACGALILAAVAASYSPACAGALLVGSATGSLVGATLGAHSSELAHGLWGFNPALTSLAVAVFFVPTRESAALAVGGAAATAVAFAGAKAACGSLAAPALTLPFCVVASACYLLERKVPGLALAASPHSPEQNRRPS